MSGLLKKYLGGETLFVNTFSNNTQGARHVTLVQSTPGEIREVELTGNSICLQPGAYICSTPSLNLGIAFAGFAFGDAGALPRSPWLSSRE